MYTRPAEARARKGNHDTDVAGNPHRNPALDNRPDMLKKGMHSPSSLRVRNLAQMNKLALSADAPRYASVNGLFYRYTRSLLTLCPKPQWQHS